MAKKGQKKRTKPRRANHSEKTKENVKGGKKNVAEIFFGGKTLSTSQKRREGSTGFENFKKKGGKRAQNRSRGLRGERIAVRVRGAPKIWNGWRALECAKWGGFGREEKEMFAKTLSRKKFGQEKVSGPSNEGGGTKKSHKECS